MPNNTISKPVDSPVLDAQARALFERACSLVNPERLQALLASLVDIHSPTGEERDICEFLADHLHTMGLQSAVQPITDTSSNVWGRLRGDGTGPSVMLYAPIDTHLEANESDLPWAGKKLTPDMLPEAIERGNTVVGLGASNPKGMAAALIEAVNALIDAEPSLKGDLMIAFAGGGMPVIVPERNHAGLSNGVMHLLTHGVTADYGVVLKPWDEVYYEQRGVSQDSLNILQKMGYKMVEQTPWGATELILVGLPGAAGVTPVNSGNDSAVSGKVREGYLYGANDVRRPAGAATGY